MKKILIIHTGGTFGMTPVEPDSILAPGNLQNQLINNVPELVRLADIETAIPFNLDSSNIGIKEWDILAKLIHKQMDLYDGFVIIHGTDTMAYTASALSFSLLNLKKPVVLTGSQRPLSKLRSDARSNLIDAIELAAMNIPEVLIVFGQLILRGNRAKKISITSYDAFTSPGYPYLGEIGLKIVLNRSKLFKTKDEFYLLEGFTPEAAIVNVLPSLPPDYFNSLLETNLKAFILLGFGAGHLPNYLPDWVPFIKSAGEKGKAVFIGSHSLHGSVDLSLYECGQNAIKAGAVGLGDMTFESAYVKLLKILKLTTDREEIHEKFNQNWAGEI